MDKNIVEKKDNHGWFFCPNNPGILRRVVGENEDGFPIIEEKTVAELHEELDNQLNTIRRKSKKSFFYKRKINILGKCKLGFRRCLTISLASTWLIMVLPIDIKSIKIDIDIPGMFVKITTLFT